MTNSIHIDLLGTETHFVKSRGYLTRVIEVRNDKPPLILLHGGGGHAETFSRNLNTLAAVCRPIAMDFIWHGMSRGPLQRWHCRGRRALVAAVHPAGARSHGGAGIAVGLIRG